MMALLFVLNFAHAALDPGTRPACGPLLNEIFYLHEMEKPRPIDGLFNELDLLGFLLPKETIFVKTSPVKLGLHWVDRIRFSQHKAADHWGSTYFRLKYLAGEETVRQIEFKNWKDRGLPSEARARRNPEGGWDVTTSALFDEGVPHHHLLLKYSSAGVLEEILVTTREPGLPKDVTRFVPHAPRDAR